MGTTKTITVRPYGSDDGEYICTVVTCKKEFGKEFYSDHQYLIDTKYQFCSADDLTTKIDCLKAVDEYLASELKKLEEVDYVLGSI